MEAVQKVKCINNAWFVLSFELVSAEGGILSSDDLPIQRSRTLNLTTSDFQEGTVFKVSVRAAMGKSQQASTILRFLKNGRSAVFEVSGTSPDFTIRLVEVK